MYFCCKNLPPNASMIFNGKMHKDCCVCASTYCVQHTNMRNAHAPPPPPREKHGVNFWWILYTCSGIQAKFLCISCILNSVWSDSLRPSHPLMQWVLGFTRAFKYYDTRMHICYHGIFRSPQAPHAGWAWVCYGESITYCYCILLVRFIAK